ncbi:ABC transporter ATP-binding protein [Halobellus sp. EA9]|uniref:ABC transporter ATP-binding protein n=1 Tax=Halobellus sp. EA9 TaxID=3421647 RepID=UPI003EBF86CB
MSDPILEFNNVTKIYGDGTVAIEDISFDVERGTTTVFVGPSGCGKTTTLELVNRLIELTEGTISFDGQDIQDIDKIDLRRRFGYVIQEIGLFDHMTVAENVGIVPKLLGWDQARIDDRVDELLNLVEMPADTYRDQFPGELSGGQRQRIGVARALAADPEVMLMDEPFGALDPITREKLQNEFLDLQEQIDTTILFVTHDIDEALKMGDRIAIYNEGGIVQYDTPKEILTNPANQFVRDFLGSDQFLKELKFVSVTDVMNTENSVTGKSVSELAAEDHGYDFPPDGEDIATVDSTETTHVALTKLYQGNASSVPVTKGGEVIGVITESDLKERLS